MTYLLIAFLSVAVLVELYLMPMRMVDLSAVAWIALTLLALLSKRCSKVDGSKTWPRPESVHDLQTLPRLHTAKQFVLPPLWCTPEVSNLPMAAAKRAAFLGICGYSSHPRHWYHSKFVFKPLTELSLRSSPTRVISK